MCVLISLQLVVFIEIKKWTRSEWIVQNLMILAKHRVLRCLSHSIES